LPHECPADGLEIPIKYHVRIGEPRAKGASCMTCCAGVVSTSRRPLPQYASLICMSRTNAGNPTDEGLVSRDLRATYAWRSARWLARLRTGLQISKLAPFVASRLARYGWARQCNGMTDSILPAIARSIDSLREMCTGTLPLAVTAVHRLPR
jgi:hypothetical protein